MGAGMETVDFSVVGRYTSPDDGVETLDDDKYANGVTSRCLDVPGCDEFLCCVDVPG